MGTPSSIIGHDEQPSKFDFIRSGHNNIVSTRPTVRISGTAGPDGFLRATQDDASRPVRRGERVALVREPTVGIVRHVSIDGDLVIEPM